MTETKIKPVAPQAQGTRRETNPFWYRENAPYLRDVTLGASNSALGINEIVLNSASEAQRAWGCVYNGHLKTIIGRIFFQVVMTDSQSLYIHTISTESTKENGEKDYFEHISLNASVKAQILRLAEALMNGMTPAMIAQQAQMAQFAQQQPQMNPFMQMQGQFNPFMQQQPMAQPGFAPMGYQQPMGFQPQQMYAQPFGQQQQQYVPPAPQPMGNTGGAPAQTQTETAGALAPNDDLPI